MKQKNFNEGELWENSFLAPVRCLGKNLSAQGYSHRSLTDYIRVVKHFCYWHTKHGAQKVLDESIIDEFIDHFAFGTCPIPGRGSYRLCHAALSHFLTVLRKMGLAPQLCRPVLPEDKVLQTFQDHLTKVCGHAKTSAKVYVRYLRPFLQDLNEGGGRFAFHSLTPRDVEVFVVRMAASYKPQTAKLYCTSLRAFFKFLRLTEEIELPLENAVPRIPHWKLSNIPKYLTEKKVDAFLSSFDVRTTIGLRNRAMALLMATAGLRAGEVAKLKLGDIDWRKSSIRINNTKSRRIDCLPLSIKAGEALAAYLKRKPQAQTRHVFVSLATPVGKPLTSSAVSIAMRRAFKRCYPGEPAYGTHVLRHSLATRMLKDGATFKEIADILRHRNIETTAIYAKVDLKSLKHTALPWPEVTI